MLGYSMRSIVSYQINPMSWDRVLLLLTVRLEGSTSVLVSRASEHSQEGSAVNQYQALTAYSPMAAS